MTAILQSCSYHYSTAQEPLAVKLVQFVLSSFFHPVLFVCIRLNTSNIVIYVTWPQDWLRGCWCTVPSCLVACSVVLTQLPRLFRRLLYVAHFLQESSLNQKHIASARAFLGVVKKHCGKCSSEVMLYQNELLECCVYSMFVRVSIADSVRSVGEASLMTIISVLSQLLLLIKLNFKDFTHAWAALILFFGCNNGHLPEPLSQ